MKESGLKCSVNEEIAIKTDITDFLDIPLSTLNSYLSKRRYEIKPIELDKKTIRAIGSKASRLNGYHVQDVGTIALGMDSVVGIGLKEKMFGRVSSLAKFETKGEIEWQQILAEIFAGFSFYHNYQIGNYRVDFYVKELDLILEHNGYDDHAHYDPIDEMKREQFFNNYRVVRFHHQTDLKTLFNSILRAKIGTIIKLYNENVGGLHETHHTTQIK
jgi:very-short-patch-repair endonuclease